MSTYNALLEFYYNGEMTWWERWGYFIVMAIVGVVATVVACLVAGPCGAAASLATVGASLGKIISGTLIGAAISLTVGGVVAGIQSAVTGHGFWQGFAKSVQDNFLEAVVTSFAFSAVTVALSNVIQHYQCFKEGTLVETEDGLKPIEEIEIGDKVLAYNEETGDQAYKEVVRLFRNTTEEWYHIYANGEEIVCTGGHPFYLANLDKFAPTRELKFITPLAFRQYLCYNTSEKVCLQGHFHGVLQRAALICA